MEMAGVTTTRVVLHAIVKMGLRTPPSRKGTVLVCTFVVDDGFFGK